MGKTKMRRVTLTFRASLNRVGIKATAAKLAAGFPSAENLDIDLPKRLASFDVPDADIDAVQAVLDDEDRVTRYTVKKA